MEIETQIPLLDEILDRWKPELGADHAGYRNHVYRVIHFCFGLRVCGQEERRKLVIAGCFHDLGIWANGTIDYLPPSMDLARQYLRTNQLEGWSDEIDLIIDMHHKFRSYRDDRYPLVEVFRKADLVDVSLGMVRSGLPAEYVRQVKAQFPNAGFHKRLGQLAAGWFSRHPLSPPPFMKW